MCGRFAATATVGDLTEWFDLDQVVDEPVATFNAAPTDAVPAIVARFDVTADRVVRKLVTPRWGLVPSWSKTPSGGARMINARSETVATKPAFARAFATRRCLIPADGFYEWKTVTDVSGKSRKQPWFIRPAEGGMMVMAGIYEFWKDRSLGADAVWLTTCSIITAASTDALGHLHDRMPMVVARADWRDWLDPTLTDPHAAQALLRVDGGERVRTYEVAPLVNSVRNDGPELLLPLA